ncbi:MAG: sulfite exporter TauE/SafE family protein, partial [Clostridia bacterium]|nr:sulfite exporter TauE/SafE family protein [Clostridia bacterium]
MEDKLITGLLLFLIGGGGGFIQRVSGFGLGIFVMLFLPHMLPTHTAAATISCLFSCGTSSYNAVKFRRDVPFRTVLPLLAAALVTIPIAVFFSARVSAATFKLILGIVLIALSLYFLIFARRIHIKPTVTNGLLAGAIGGTLNGLFSTGGPPVVLYMTHATTDNLAYFAGIQFYFALTNIYATTMRIFSGAVTWELLAYAAVGFAGCMVGDR